MIEKTIKRPQLVIIIVTYNSGSMIGDCLRALWLQLQPGTEVYLVDNASTNSGMEGLEEKFPGIHIIRNVRNVGYAAANNQVLHKAHGEYSLLLNPDVILEPNALSIAIDYLETHPTVGILGAKVLLPDGRLDPPARRSFKTPVTYLYKILGFSWLFPRHPRFGRYYLSFLDENELSDVDAIVGAFFLIRRNVIDQIGLLDERFFMYCEDEDWCWRAKEAGWRVIYHPGVAVYHWKGHSTSLRPFFMIYHWHRSIFLYHRKNIAGRYIAIVNFLVYIGMFLSLVGRLWLAGIRRLVFKTVRSGMLLQQIIKRIMDIGIAAILLVLLLPFFVIIAFLIRVTSKGSIFYQWRVVGQCGRPFTGYKFRTMAANADEIKETLIATNEMLGPVFKMRNDPRVTRLGKFLRRHSLDELPQLWSVLKGDMSLVGPRPPLQSEYPFFTGAQKKKLAVKPGITCIWQISGRNEVCDFDEWVKLDMEYIQNWSLGLDLKILLKTIPVMLSGRGAS